MLADAWEESSAQSIFKAFSKPQIDPAETRLNNSELQTESIVSESMMEIVNEVGNSWPMMNFRLHCSCQTNKF